MGCQGYASPGGGSQEVLSSVSEKVQNTVFLHKNMLDNRTFFGYVVHGTQCSITLDFENR